MRRRAALSPPAARHRAARTRHPPCPAAPAEAKRGRRPSRWLPAGGAQRSAHRPRLRGARPPARCPPRVPLTSAPLRQALHAGVPAGRGRWAAPLICNPLRAERRGGGSPHAAPPALRRPRSPAGVPQPVRRSPASYTVARGAEPRGRRPAGQGGRGIALLAPAAGRRGTPGRAPR